MTFIPPMLCSRLERLERLTERRYIAEPKLDGQRTQEHVSERRIVVCCSVDFEGYGDSGPML